MKTFVLEPNMLNLRGVFYPTGYLFLMFPTLADALSGEQLLLDDGYTGESISLLDPQVILDRIGRTLVNASVPRPSRSAEANLVRRYAEFAAQGHHALLIHAPSAEETEHIMTVLARAKISLAQKYRHLKIEDLG